MSFVIRATTVAELTRELPEGGVVRINLAHRPIDQITTRYTLRLTAVTTDNNVITLTVHRNAVFVDQAPGSTLRDAMLQLQHLTEDHLRARGFDVRGGEIATDTNLIELNGVIEIARLLRTADETWKVESANADEA